MEDLFISLFSKLHFPIPGHGGGLELIPAVTEAWTGHQSVTSLTQRDYSHPQPVYPTSMSLDCGKKSRKHKENIQTPQAAGRF